MSSSYRQILKSSALIGGSSIINVLLGVVRTKVMAVLIGTEGMGLFGAFSSVTALVGGIAGMGINTSGVRQIAAAMASNDPQRTARTIVTIRRAAFFLGSLGMLSLLALSKPIAQATFGNPQQALALALLSVTILCSAVTAGQTALLQGHRRIGDLAALNVWGSVFGTAISIPLIFLLRAQGIVPVLVAVSALALLTSWWYARRVKTPRITLCWSEFCTELRSLVGLGMVFMSAGLMMSAVSYLTRVLVIHQMSLEASGLYQAAWTLSSVYVGFILSAMGADYYPRLTAVANDHKLVDRLVNEQTEVSLLLALPGVLGTLAFAPGVLHLLYSPHFAPAAEIVRWQTLGVLGRVITWPMGFVVLAKGCARTFLWMEIASNLLHLGFIWLGLRWFGLRGLGLAFFGLYVFYGFLVFAVVRKLVGFHWTVSNARLIAAGLLLGTLVLFLTSGILPQSLGVALSGIVFLATCFYSMQRLGQILGCPLPLLLAEKLRARFRIAAA